MGTWIRENINYIVGFILGVIITSLLFIIFQKQKEIEMIREIEKPIITEITTTKTDTIYLTKSVSKPEIIKEEIIRVDTIKELMEIPIISKEYITKIDNDSVSGEIKAVIQGYKAELTSLDYKLNIPIYSTEKTITEQITKVKTKHFNFMIGVGGGYGLITRKPDVFIGGMVGYSF